MVNCLNWFWVHGWLANPACSHIKNIPSLYGLLQYVSELWNFWNNFLISVLFQLKDSPQLFKRNIIKSKEKEVSNLVTYNNRYLFFINYLGIYLFNTYLQFKYGLLVSWWTGSFCYKSGKRKSKHWAGRPKLWWKNS